jgi:hypothetical protein
MERGRAVRDSPSCQCAEAGIFSSKCWAVRSISLTWLREARQINSPTGPNRLKPPGDWWPIILKTPLGPVELGGAIGDYGRGEFFFQVCRIF